MNVRRDNALREPTYPKEGTMSEQRTLPTARDLARMHDAQAHILRTRLGKTEEEVDHDHINDNTEAFNEKILEYERELGIPPVEEIEVFLSFTNMIDLGPISAMRAFAMLIAGLQQNHFEVAVQAGWDPHERDAEIEQTFTVENMERQRELAMQQGPPQGIGELLAALGGAPLPGGLFVEGDPDTDDQDSEPDVK